MLIFSERHLRSVPTEYARGYNGRQPNRSRQLRGPRPDASVADLSQERIKRRHVLGDLINEYPASRIEAQIKANGRVLAPHTGIGAAQHGDLVPQHEHLSVFGSRRPAQQDQPAAEPDEGEVEQAEEHE